MNHMARRGENIYLRKDGRYEGRYTRGRKPDGKIIYQSVYGQTLAECKQKLTEAKVLHFQSDTDCKIYGTGTVEEFMTYWLYDIVRYNLKESTFSNYVHYSNKWIIPYLGKEKLYKLTTEHIQQFINHLIKQGLSAGSIRNVYRTLCAMLNSAKVFSYLKMTPCENVELPNYKTKEAETLSLDDQRTLEIAAKQSKNVIGLTVLIALYTGLRLGEICALAWNDIDFKNDRLSVSNTRQRIQLVNSSDQKKTHVITDRAKSSSSIRVIPLPHFLLKLLEEHQSKHSMNDYVLSYKDKPLEPRMIQYQLKKLLKQANLKQVNFHTLRHTFATRCMEENVDVKTISELLAHALAKTTLDLYGHSRYEQKQEAMKKLNNLGTT